MKVAIIGGPETGKTTFLEALARREIRKDGGDGCVYEVRLSMTSPKQTETQIDTLGSDNGSPSTSLTTVHECPLGDTEHRILEVEMDEQLLDMRGGARLVFIDGPSDDKLKAMWESLDCLIVVINIVDGPQSPEDFLRSVQELRKKKKALPLVVVCNRIDTLGDVDVALYLNEKVDLIDQIFGGARLLAPECKDPRDIDGSVPLVLPTSFLDLKFFRMASSRMSVVDIRRIFPVLVERLCRQKIGNIAWRALTEEERIHQAQKDNRIQSSTELQELLDGTNFGNLCRALQTLLGSDEVLSKKLEYESSRMTLTPDRIDEQLHAFKAQCDALNLSHEVQKKHWLNQRNRFWSLFRDECDATMRDLRKRMNVARLAPVMDTLIQYRHFCENECWSEEAATAQGTMHEIIVGILNFFTFMASTWNLSQWKQTLAENDKREFESWCSLSPLDWRHIISSILLVRNNLIVGSMSRHLLMLEKQKDVFLTTINACCIDPECELLSCNNRDHANILAGQKMCHEDGKINEHYDDRICNPIVQRDVEISDASHWGHLLWKYSGILDSKNLCSPLPKGKQLDMSPLYASEEPRDDERRLRQGRTNRPADSTGEQECIGPRSPAEKCNAPAAVETTESVTKNQARTGTSGECAAFANRPEVTEINESVGVADDDVSVDSPSKGSIPSEGRVPVEQGVAGEFQSQPHKTAQLPMPSKRSLKRKTSSFAVKKKRKTSRGPSTNVAQGVGCRPAAEEEQAAGPRHVHPHQSLRTEGSNHAASSSSVKLKTMLHSHQGKVTQGGQTPEEEARRLQSLRMWQRTFFPDSSKDATELQSLCQSTFVPDSSKNEELSDGQPSAQSAATGTGTGEDFETESPTSPPEGTEHPASERTKDLDVETTMASPKNSRMSRSQKGAHKNHEAGTINIAEKATRPLETTAETDDEGIETTECGRREHRPRKQNAKSEGRSSLPIVPKIEYVVEESRREANPLV
jgi:GTPase SAR1 family protein